MRFGFYVFVWTGVLTAGSMPGDTAHATHKTVAVSTKVVLRTDPRSGQTVRTVTITPRTVESRAVAPRENPVVFTPLPDLSDVKGLVAAAARQYEVSPELIDSVIQVESNYNARAVSPKGAQGLMQLMPDTARRFGVQNTFDPKQNIEGGVRYLKFLQETFKDERLAIAAYNAGEGAVQKYGNVPPYPETMNYVFSVGKKYGEARRAVAQKRLTPSTVEEKPKLPEYRKLVHYVDSEGRVYLTTQ